MHDTPTTFALPRHRALGTPRKRITRETHLHNASPVVRDLWVKHLRGEKDAPFFSSIHFINEVPEALVERVEGELTTQYVANSDGFIADLGDEIRIYASTARGLLYGAVTLLRIAGDDGLLPEGLMYDYPGCSMRSARIHLPPVDQVEWFKSLIDLLVYYRYNTIIIEVGGGMEYKRHPEVNTGWVDYCAELASLPGEIKDVKNGFSWFKNSIHTEVAGGSFLSQETVRKLVMYCRDRYIDVIPEVPSLSHSDYLLANHRELAERAEDPYPDTYCPSNHRSYNLLFDVLDEVCDVFEPRSVNIGHDEWYSIGLCKKCAGRDPADLYAMDIERIRAHLTERGVRTAMGSDKLLDAIDTFGYPCGGAEVPVRKDFDHDGEVLSVIPATHRAIDFISPNILIHHWYWSLGRHHEARLAEHSMSYTFGNFYAFMFPDWSARVGNAGGITVSHWSSVREDYMQRTQAFLLNLALSSYLAWNQDYEDTHYDALLEWTFDELYAYRNRSVTSDAATPSGTRYVEVLHTTDHRIEYKPFNDSSFIDIDRYNLGSYVLEYDDGTECAVPIIYGQNISNRDVEWSRTLHASTNYYTADMLLLEASWSTRPVKADGVTYYRHVVPNPNPIRHIANVRVETPTNADYTIYVKELVVH